MKVLIIHCLPNEFSFTRKLKNAFITGLKENRHQIEEIDLIQNQFDPLLYIPSHANPTDIQIYQDKINSAELLVLAYPCWWSGMPALMKGFMDRVLTTGFAFRYDRGKSEGLLKKIRAAYVISSMSNSFWDEFFNLYGARSFFSNIKGILQFCGIKKIHRIQAYSLTKNTPNSLAQRYITLAKRAGQAILKD